MKIYVASSFRNERYPLVLQALREDGHDVYDWRDNDNVGGRAIETPEPDSLQDLARSITSQLAAHTYSDHMHALNNCDACVLVLPCGRSAHLEAGYAFGRGKDLIILFDPEREPFGRDLMYGMAYALCVEIKDVVRELRTMDRRGNRNRELFKRKNL